MEQIYEYLDYRQYLREYYETEKEKKPQFSLRLFGRLSGLDASYLSKIMKEQRHIGLQFLPGLIKALKLTKAEGDYLENLIHFNQAKTEDQKQHYFELLLSMRRPHTHNLTEEQFEFYTKWYYTALRNLLEFYEFHKGDNFTELGQKLSPAITELQAQRSIELLEKLSLISLDANNRYTLTDAAISTGDTWSSIAVRNFQKETILLSSESLERHPQEMRDISSVTMNITEKEFVAIKDMIRKFRSSVIHYVNEVPEPDRVYQVNIQLIPLSESDEANGDEV